MNADPDPGGKMNADSCGSGSTALLVAVHFFLNKISNQASPVRIEPNIKNDGLFGWISGPPIIKIASF